VLSYWRILFAVGLSIMAGCGMSGPTGSEPATNVGLFVLVDGDSGDASTAMETAALGDDARFRFGIVTSAVSRSESGQWAFRLVFREAPRGDDWQLLEGLLLDYGLEDWVWLDRDDLWPDCSLGASCMTVAEFGGL
jgi:hypothetical protein